MAVRGKRSAILEELLVSSLATKSTSFIFFLAAPAFRIIAAHLAASASDCKSKDR